MDDNPLLYWERDTVLCQLRLHEPNTICHQNAIPVFKDEDRKEEEIEKEIDLLQEWIINRALSATKKGEEGTSDIYTKILLQFSKNRKNKQTTPSIDEIRDRILSIAEKTESYVAMGFISQPDYQSVLSVIEKVQPQNVESVYNILSPYMEMQENKLSALDDLVETISHFTTVHENPLTFWETSIFSTV